MITKEQKREAYRKLPSEIQDFIMDNETTEIISACLKEVGLSEDQTNLADSEILYSMLGLQSFSVAMNNIAQIAKRPIESLLKLKSNLEDKIFNNIPKPQNGGNQKIEAVLPEKQSEVGNDFEQIILNQARAMQGAKEAPDNLPTGESNTNTTDPNRTVHDYKEGNDPYREPIA